MPPLDIRGVLLSIVHEQQSQLTGGSSLQEGTLLQAVSQKLVSKYGGTAELEQAILTQWQELFRTGLLAWGLNLNNPRPPFFHLTERGRQALSHLTRDPNNPAGYLRHLESRAKPGNVTKSYVVEGLNCFGAGLHKAAAVMIGVAAENTILELRDLVVAQLDKHQKPVARDLKSGWQVRAVTTELTKIFDNGIDRKKHRELYENYENNWRAFTGQIRTVRNEAGHPNSIEPVTYDTVHASFLIFPELARLADGLWDWVTDDMFPA